MMKICRLYRKTHLKTVLTSILVSVSIMLGLAMCRNPASSMDAGEEPIVILRQVTIGFNANGGEGIIPARKTVDINTYITLPTGEGLSKPNTDGHVYEWELIGWSKNTEEQSPFYGAGTPFLATQDKTLYAKWDRPPFSSVTFNGSGAEGDSFTLRGPPGAMVFLPSGSPFTSPGYHFIGWSTREGSATVEFTVGSEYQLPDPVENISLFAVWEKLLTVSFDPSGGTGHITPISVPRNTDITLPLGGFTRKFFDFKGWSPSLGAVSGSLPGSTYTVTQDITLYAAWDRPFVTVHFDSNEGNGIIEPDTALRGESKPLPKVGFERAGFILAGWVDKDGNVYALGQDFLYYRGNNTTIILYAHWIGEDVPLVTVSFSANDGEGYANDVTVPQGTAIQLPGSDKFTRETHHLSGWAESSLPINANAPYAVDGGYTANSNITLHAVWSRPTHTITFHANFEGTGSGSVSGLLGDTVNLLDGQDFSRKNHSIVGWSTTYGEGAKIEYALDGNFTVKKDITLYAVWEIWSLLTFHPNGGQGSSPRWVKRGMDTTLPNGDVFLRSFYDIIGWSLSSGDTNTVDYALEGNFTVSGDITFYAVWEARPVLQFDPNGGIGDPPPPVNDVSKGTAITLPGRNLLAKPDYTFIGWNTQPGNDGIFYEPGESYTVTGNATLYAVWDYTPGSLTVNGPSSVERGTSETFSVVESIPGAIDWSIDELVFDGRTTIHGGLLTVGQGEAGTGANLNDLFSLGTLTVRATSRDNSEVTGTAVINLTGQIVRGDWRMVRIGQDHTMAIAWDNSLWVWGRNHEGQLGLGDWGATAFKNVPTKVGSNTDWVTISGGLQHTFGIRGTGAAGTLWSWGNTAEGRLGIGTAAGRRVEPTQVTQAVNDNWTQVSGGFNFSLGIRSDGTLWAWGRGEHGRLGDAATLDRNAPVKVGSSTQRLLPEWRFIAASAGASHGVAIRVDGTLWGWGTGEQGQLGPSRMGATNSTPAQIKLPVPHDNLGFRAVSAGSQFTVAIDENGDMWVWGNNRYGQRGNGASVNTETVNAGTLAQREANAVPQRITHTTSWRSVDLSNASAHVLAIDSDGALWTWGSNERGQIGLGSGTTGIGDATMPKEQLTMYNIMPGTRWVSSAAGGWFSLAVQENGDLYAWGDGSHGQLGHGYGTGVVNSYQENTPVKVVR